MNTNSSKSLTETIQASASSGEEMNNPLPTGSRANQPVKHTWILIAWMLQIVLPIRLLNDLGDALPNLRTAAFALLAFIVGIAMLPTTRQWIDRHRKQLLLVWGSALFTFVLLELSLSVLFKFHVIPYLTTDFPLMVYENSNQTLSFDPVRGVTLSPTPSRFTRVVEGTHEYVGVIRGNAQGFPDRDDFAVRKVDPQRRRYAVFGDSFTAAQYLDMNWPDRVEDLLREQNIDVELLNFSVDGGGLINWWSVITRHLAETDYELDGVIFAVYTDDLSRRFFIADHQQEKRPLIGRMPFGMPDELPKSFAEARPHLSSSGIIVDTDIFERILAGANVRERKWSPYLLTNYDYWVRAQKNQHMLEVVRETLKGHPIHETYIAGIREFLESRSLPAIVIHVPQPRELTNDPMYNNHAGETQEFARGITARWVDGCLPFRDLTPEQIQENWFHDDPHWNQSGSDRFANFVAQELAEWRDTLAPRENSSAPQH